MATKLSVTFTVTPEFASKLVRMELSVMWKGAMESLNFGSGLRLAMMVDAGPPRRNYSKRAGPNYTNVKLINPESHPMASHTGRISGLSEFRNEGGWSPVGVRADVLSTTLGINQCYRLKSPRLPFTCRDAVVGQGNPTRLCKVKFPRNAANCVTRFGKVQLPVWPLTNSIH